MAVDDSKKPVHEMPVVPPRDDVWSQGSVSVPPEAPSRSGRAAGGSHAAGAPAEGGLPPMPPRGAPGPPPSVAGSSAATAPVGNPYDSAPPPAVGPSPVPSSGGVTAPLPSAPISFSAP